MCLKCHTINNNKIHKVSVCLVCIPGELPAELRCAMRAISRPLVGTRKIHAAAAAAVAGESLPRLHCIPNSLDSLSLSLSFSIFLFVYSRRTIHSACIAVLYDCMWILRGCIAHGVAHAK